jgi:hypothetical protein
MSYTSAARLILGQSSNPVAIQGWNLAAFPMHYYPALSAIQSCHLIRSGLSRLPHPAVRGGMATPVGATGSKVQFVSTGKN